MMPLLRSRGPEEDEQPWHQLLVHGKILTRQGRYRNHGFQSQPFGFFPGQLRQDLIVRDRRRPHAAMHACARSERGGHAYGHLLEPLQHMGAYSLIEGADRAFQHRIFRDNVQCRPAA
ncbi:hypothetical protein D3C71_1535330 [compost metagenome]